MPKPRALHEMPATVRAITLTVEQVTDRWWQVSAHVEPQGRRNKREIYRLVDSFTIRLDHPVTGLDGMYEALAQATLQQRLPGIG